MTLNKSPSQLNDMITFVSTLIDVPETSTALTVTCISPFPSAELEAHILK